MTKVYSLKETLFKDFFYVSCEREALSRDGEDTWTESQHIACTTQQLLSASVCQLSAVSGR